jgi:hypothetical protein
MWGFNLKSTLVIVLAIAAIAMIIHSMVYLSIQPESFSAARPFEER